MQAKYDKQKDNLRIEFDGDEKRAYDKFIRIAEFYSRSVSYMASWVDPARAGLFNKDNSNSTPLPISKIDIFNFADSCLDIKEVMEYLYNNGVLPDKSKDLNQLKSFDLTEEAAIRVTREQAEPAKRVLGFSV